MARKSETGSRGDNSGTPPAAGANAPEFSVTELAGAIKRTLEDGFGYVRLRGEVSGYRGPHASGHCYFGLKDEKAKIDAVVWRGVFSKLKVRPEEGMEVIAHGRVTSYPGASKYQIVIDRLEPAGVGALMALLEERKKKFAAEGLFDPERKKAVPFLPKVVGIVTSPTGAVIRDMLAGFHERFPTRVMVWPVRVQGETSGGEVARAIAGFNAMRPGDAIARPDVLIVARGGGSLEDLWGFNDEAVVRATAESDIPIISAVGHETDWTLIDLVADARAPTPTKAAEWVVPNHTDLLEQMGGLGTRLMTVIRRQLDVARTHLKAAARGLPNRDDLLALPRQRFDAADKRLGRALLANTRAHHTRQARVAGRLHPRLLLGRLQRAGEHLNVLSNRQGQALRTVTQVRRQRLQSASQLLNSLSYQSVLARGFALVRDANARPVRDVASATAAQQLDVQFQDGRLTVKVADPGQSQEAEKKRAIQPQSDKPRTMLGRKPRKTDQGSLF
ncbi:MAG: exodeoxyribonuclease VII large subunit [Hyphomicrobiaceae bacterium]